LAHLLDRNYSLATVRSYGHDLLAFCRWLAERDVDLEQVSTEDLLGFLRDAARHGCRAVRAECGRHGRSTTGPVCRDDDQPQAGDRAVRVRGSSATSAMSNPVPKGREARWRVAGERSGTPRIRLVARFRGRRCACASRGACRRRCRLLMRRCWRQWPDLA
jgi:hypothetical protein